MKKMIIAIIMLLSISGVLGVKFYTTYNPFTGRMDYYTLDTNLFNSTQCTEDQILKVNATSDWVCSADSGGINYWQVSGSWMWANTTAGGKNEMNMTTVNATNFYGNIDWDYLQNSEIYNSSYEYWDNTTLMDTYNTTYDDYTTEFNTSYLNITGCADNEIWKVDGNSWNCEADATGAGAVGNPFDQVLNTTSSVTFDNVTISSYLAIGKAIDKSFQLDVQGNIRSKAGNLYLDNYYDLRWADSTTYIEGYSGGTVGNITFYARNNERIKVNTTGVYINCTDCLTGTEIAELTDADISNTLTCSDLVAGSEVVDDSEVSNDLTIVSSTWVNSTGGMGLKDNDKFYFGTGDDACMYWNGTDLVTESPCT